MLHSLLISYSNGQTQRLPSCLHRHSSSSAFGSCPNPTRSVFSLLPLLLFFVCMPPIGLTPCFSGFISIDCGSNSSYTEPATGINYVSDSNYVETGLAITLPSSSYSGTLLQQLRSLRSFPNGTRNCYNIQVKLGIKYLIRASFFYPNYDAQNNIPEFDLYFGPDFWVTVNLGDNIKNIINNEIIHITTSNQVQICLVNSGNGVPFVSALELRPLPNTTYVTTTGSLSTFLRLDTGSPNDYLIR